MNSDKSMNRHLSMFGAWAFAIGTAVGWGSLVVTSNTYLAQSGPAGSILGLIAGALIMLVIGWNYAYMMRCFPEDGGSYTFTKEVFGYDMGFLASWFAAMTYFAMLWANATSLPLFGRIFLGGVFSFGKLYTIFGYQVYFGEALLSISALLLFGFLCSRNKRFMAKVQTVLALLFSVVIIAAFIAAIFGLKVSTAPAYIPDHSSLSEIIKIAVISPWAFIGFESISHQTEEFDFDHKKINRLMLIAVVTTAALYIMVTLLSVTAFPARYSSWLAYIRDLDNLSGIEALPAFYAANTYLGSFGVWMLMAALLSLVITSLIGNITSLSRLFYSLAKDQILPVRYAELNNRNHNRAPSNAIWLVVGISCFIPFLGRTAIGWIVDVTTIGAVIIYSLVSASTASYAKSMDDKLELWTGRIGTVVMIALGIYFLLPNLITKGTLATETYFLFIIWSIFGFLFFRYILQHDTKKRFGVSISVWVALLALVLVISLIWMRQSMMLSFDNTLAELSAYYDSHASVIGNPEAEQYVLEKLDALEISNNRTMLMTVGMFGFALIVMLTNHSYMNKRARESDAIANRDPMTGVLSKRAYMEKEQEINSEILENQSKDFAVVVCDVNGLKKINDTLGHKAGDEYIKKACTMICDIFQHSPVYRIGGDEFVAILNGRDYSIRKELLEALHDRSVDHIGKDEAVVSGGMSDFNSDTDTNYHTVFERADELMYQEKQLLKSLGAVTRDDESDNVMDLSLEEETEIISIRRSILIVEDSEINQQLLGSVLEDSYNILYASDGAEAIEALKDHSTEIALMMLDLQMPIMNGIDVLKAMKEDDSISSIPVIVLTADQDAELECLKLGAMDFIPKPYPIWEVVRARVEKCIELSEDRNIIQSTERDSLTKLFNIDYFFRYVKIFDQHYWDMPMDAVVIDVNHFHMINERYGKQYGDSILRRIGERIRQIARQVGGVGCRQGADTFLLYCPHREDYQEILDQISTGVTGSDSSANRIRLRLGVYEQADKNLDIERRYDRAKLASDTAKSSFQHISIYDDQMGRNALYKERLLDDYRTALREKQFVVYFQPKFDIRPEKPLLASAEALVRWIHPELGMISPAVFIPLLEENGLILDLDTYVWRETAAQIRKWKDEFGYSVPVSVNVSRIDMLMPNLKDTFSDILAAHQLSSDDIILEITESAYAGDSDQVISTARELRGMGMGFRIEMDDFGTGYSSLGMLTHLPIDALKLDMTFIKNAFGETRDVRMIELIIDIADYLHVPVVAEGVETQEQYLVLKAMGCDLIQGYYFSRPVPPSEFARFLEERKDQSVEVTPAIKKTYMSISKALTSNFETIYYVDTVTDYYLEFDSGQEKDLEIHPGAHNFFEDFREKLIPEIVEEDREKLNQILQKETLLAWISQPDRKPLTFHRIRNGQHTEYSIEAIQTRSSDDHHIVIGIRAA